MYLLIIFIPKVLPRFLNQLYFHYYYYFFLGETSLRKPANQQEIKDQTVIHKKKSKGCSHNCGICSKSFYHLKSLDKHLTKHLLPENRTLHSYQCDQCDKTFTKEKNMNTHRALIHDLF